MMPGGAAALGVCLLAAIAADGAAQTYPVRPIRLVVPSAPGGGTDLSARVIGQGHAVSSVIDLIVRIRTGLTDPRRPYGVYLFTSMKEGWSQKRQAGRTGEKGALPAIAHLGQNQGAWFHSRHLWLQNEHTSLLPNLVDRRSFAQLLGEAEPRKDEPK